MANDTVTLSKEQLAKDYIGFLGREGGGDPAKKVYGLIQAYKDGKISTADNNIKQFIATYDPKNIDTLEKTQQFIQNLDKKAPSLINDYFKLQGVTNPDEARKTFVKERVNIDISLCPDTISVSGEDGPPLDPNMALENGGHDLADGLGKILGINGNEVYSYLEPVGSLFSSMKAITKAGLNVAPAWAKIGAFGLAAMALMNGGGTKSIGGWMSGAFTLGLLGILCAAVFSNSGHQRSHSPETDIDLSDNGHDNGSHDKDNYGGRPVRSATDLAYDREAAALGFHPAHGH